MLKRMWAYNELLNIVYTFESVLLSNKLLFLKTLKRSKTPSTYTIFIIFEKLVLVKVITTFQNNQNSIDKNYINNEKKY